MKIRKNRIPAFLQVFLLMALGICLAPSLWMAIPAFAISWLDDPTGSIQGKSAPASRARRITRKLLCAALCWFVMLESAILVSIIGQTLIPVSLSGAETMIIPGAAVYQDRPGSMQKSRLDGAIPILKNHPRMIVIVSGGRSPEDLASEAAVMKTYLVEAGISPQRIIEESQARDTIGNLEQSSGIIRDRGLNQKVVVVTSEFHGLRTAALARVSGLDPVIRGVPTKSAILGQSLLREFASWIKVQLTYGFKLSW